MGHLYKQWAMKQNGWADELSFEVLDQNKFHVWIGYIGGPYIFNVRLLLASIVFS